ncbi:MAG: ankyrin repeat domain-containing protein [Planctomycetota bacterium]
MEATHEGTEAAVQAAAARGDRRLVQALVDGGTLVNARAAGGVTALHVAAEHGRMEVVEFLLARGADVNARTDGGWTPLHGASAAGNARIVQLLLERGADLCAADDGGETALHAAVRWGREAVVAVLIHHGADVGLRTGPEGTGRVSAGPRAVRRSHRVTSPSRRSPRASSGPVRRGDRGLMRRPALTTRRARGAFGSGRRALASRRRGSGCRPRRGS